MNKAFFIINAAAGKNRLRGLFLDIAQKFCAKGLEPVVHIDAMIAHVVPAVALALRDEHAARRRALRHHAQQYFVAEVLDLRKMANALMKEQREMLRLIQR